IRLSSNNHQKPSSNNQTITNNKFSISETSFDYWLLEFIWSLPACPAYRRQAQAGNLVIGILPTPIP
ncbi:MAG: hypothetical protein Q8P64_12245, partial [Deltaproteobacteria bacterium]|nr:hypothetical protein [Deltaproteobacteria bacterium]